MKPTEIKKIMAQLEAEFLKTVKREVLPQEFKSVPPQHVKEQIKADLEMSATDALRRIKRDGKKPTPQVFKQYIMRQIVPFDDPEYYWEWWGNNIDLSNWEASQDDDFVWKEFGMAPEVISVQQGRRRRAELAPIGTTSVAPMTQAQKRKAKQVADQTAKQMLSLYTAYEKQGFPKKQVNAISKQVYDFIEQNRGRVDLDKIGEAFLSQHQTNFKQLLNNSRTKGKTLANVYEVLWDKGTKFLKAHNIKDYERQTFQRMLIDGYVYLLLRHPNTPRNTKIALVDRLRKFVRGQDRYNSMLVPYLIDVLFLKDLGRSGVADLIKDVSKLSIDHVYMLKPLVDNLMCTGDELTKVFNAVSKMSVKQKRHIGLIEPVMISLARNGKLSKSIRDKIMGVDLGMDCKSDESMNIRMALASNPNLPKKDLQVLAEDPCVSVALIANHYLKERFKR